MVYGELHKLAAQKMARESQSYTLQPTALVHEAYVRLLQQEHHTWQNRAHFFAAAAEVMRRILVDHARAAHAAKRGAGRKMETLDTSVAAVEQDPAELPALDEALTHLQAVHPRQGRIVELRFFGGVTSDETAEVLGVSTATVERGWRMARAWLLRAIGRPTRSFS